MIRGTWTYLVMSDLRIHISPDLLFWELASSFFIVKVLPCCRNAFKDRLDCQYNLKNKACQKKIPLLKGSPKHSKWDLAVLMAGASWCKWYEIATGWFPTLYKKSFPLFAPDAEVFDIRQMFLLTSSWFWDWGTHISIPFLKVFHALRLWLNQVLSWWLQIRALGLGEFNDGEQIPWNDSKKHTHTHLSLSCKVYVHLGIK